MQLTIKENVLMPPIVNFMPILHWYVSPPKFGHYNDIMQVVIISMFNDRIEVIN